MEKKKVMFFIYRLSYGGAARTIMNIVNHLDREKFEPILVTLDFTFDYEKLVKEDVPLIKLKTKRLRSAIIPLAKLMQKEQPDILFSTIPNYNTIAILAKILSRTKTKLVVREAAFLGGSFKENMLLRAYGFLYKFAKKVIALSAGVKENLVARYRVKRETIQVIYNPVDLQFIEEAKVKPLHDEHEAIFSRNRKVIVTAGRLVKEKDHATLLQAFQQVIATVDCDLVILGEGELKTSLTKLASELAIQDRVHFIEFQQNPYNYFHRANVFVLTSLTEGFGHVLVEAMATNTPVVSTRCAPGGEEVLAEGEYGRLCEVGDVEGIATELLEVLQLDDETRAQMIAKGEERAETFSVQKIVQQYEKVFLAILT